MNIPSDYEIKEITPDELHKQMDEWGPKIFSDNDTSMNSSLILSDLEKENARKLHKICRQFTRYDWEFTKALNFVDGSAVNNIQPNHFT